jgi:3-oxoacyl-[acyl-carrier protein] reductase
MDLGIAGKIALITGGSRGLGRQAALSLAAEGVDVDVAICGRSEGSLNTTAAEVSSLGVRCLPIVSDASDLDALPGLHQAVLDGLGPVDILINNVGGSGSKEDWILNITERSRADKTREDVENTSVADMETTFTRNTFNSFSLAGLVIPSMAERKWGRIINIASVWGREYGGNIAYMSAKASVIGWTKHAAASLAGDGVLVNAIAPGMIKAPGGMWDTLPKKHSAETMQHFFDSFLPMGKFGDPETVGSLIAFLASKRAGMITGTCIPVDGGQGYSLI